jgi:uncharacterized SAM-binding protein YcdF (DUF218 family)
MDDAEKKPSYLNANQVIFLPLWARWAVIGILGSLALSVTVCGIVFLFAKEWRDTVLPGLSIAQTAAGGFVIVLFVLLAEKQLSTGRLMEKTDQFLDRHLVERLSKIELPSIKKDQTVAVEQISRQEGIYGRRKDIYGANYEISLAAFKMRFWVQDIAMMAQSVARTAWRNPLSLQTLAEPGPL